VRGVAFRRRALKQPCEGERGVGDEKEVLDALVRRNFAETVVAALLADDLRCDFKHGWRHADSWLEAVVCSLAPGWHLLRWRRRWHRRRLALRASQ